MAASGGGGAENHAVFCKWRVFHARWQGARAVATPFAIPGKALFLNYPLTLNTGRIRDQWHTMMRTGKTPLLMGHLGEPFCDVHPADAEVLGIKPASILRLDSAHGIALLRARITPDVARGSLFVPMHWTD